MGLQSTPKRIRRAVIGNIARVAALGIAIAALGAGGSSAVEDPTYPGMPKFSGAGAWVAPRTVGLSHIGKADQWIRLPSIIVGAWNRPLVTQIDSRCRTLGRFNKTVAYSATGFFRSGPGATEPFGHMGPLLTRTVAFGSIPVEASVMISQPRDSENLPIGFEISQTEGTFCPGESPYPDRPDLYPQGNSVFSPATVDGEVKISISSLKVDGVDLNLTSTCRTEEFGSIALRGREWYSHNPENELPGIKPSLENIFTTPYEVLSFGGPMEGTVEIPPFVGCVTTTGEDISALLTSAVAGEVNGVTLRAEGLGNYYCLEAGAEESEPGGLCEPFPALPFP